MVRLAQAHAYGLSFTYPADDEVVGAFLRDHGEFARVELDLILDLCRGPLVDVGANIGAISLPYAQQNPEHGVVAIEAHPGIAEILTANARCNHITNIEIISAVAGETSGQIEIPLAPLEGRENVGATSVYEKGHPLISSRMIRLDDVAPAETSFVKIDVEGFEPRVLQGATQLLLERRPNLLVEVSRQRPNAAAKVRASLEATGYSLFWFFSPHLTQLDTAAREAEGGVKGDLAIFACDGTPDWPLNPVGEDWPSDVADFPYLASYGLVSVRT
jgi:FkbM family methyltransferase